MALLHGPQAPTSSRESRQAAVVVLTSSGFYFSIAPGRRPVGRISPLHVDTDRTYQEIRERRAVMSWVCTTFFSPHAHQHVYVEYIYIYVQYIIMQQRGIGRRFVSTGEASTSQSTRAKLSATSHRCHHVPEAFREAHAVPLGVVYCPSVSGCR